MRDLRDILTLQNEVAERVAQAVKAKLTPEEQARLARARPVNPEAHLAYLQGRQAVQTATEESLRKALKHFESAIQIDPKDAPAYAGVADAYYGLSNIYLSPREAMPKVEEAATKALRLDESLAEAHVSLAWALLVYDRDFRGAETHLRRAIALDGNSANAHVAYSFLLADVGRSGEVEAEVRRARELDPLSLWATIYGSLPLYFAHRYEEAARIWRESAQTIRITTSCTHSCGLVYEQQPGKLPDAVAEFERAAALDNSPEPKAQLPTPMHWRGARPRRGSCSPSWRRSPRGNTFLHTTSPSSTWPSPITPMRCNLWKRRSKIGRSGASASEPIPASTRFVPSRISRISCGE